MKRDYFIMGFLVLLAMLATYYIYINPLKFQNPMKFQKPTNIDYQNAVITIRRGMCYGMCPDYTLTIHGDGKIEWDGRHFVYPKGFRRAEINPDDVKELVDEFYRIGYFDMKDEYTANITDLPHTMTSIFVNGQTKQVIDYYGAPQELRQLETMIDDVGGAVNWIQ